MKLINFVVALLLAVNAGVLGDYQIGVGIADCTGPTAEIIFMGYAKLTQVGCGLHLRQFSRAYIIDDGETRVLYVTVDAQSMPHGVKRQVLKNLAKVYNDTYKDENFILSGTHTHGAPGGFMMELMFDIPNLGFVQETFDELVDGITKSIQRAHDNIVPGKIYLSSGELLEANINRSPAAYLENPEEERAKYEHDVDKEMVQLKFVKSDDNTPIGAINWFAIHPTSMNNTNCLVTSDNVGYASILFEGHVNEGALPGKGAFVGAFASTNLGDVSPNTKGPICIDTGNECDFVTSTCDGNAKTCIAFGPGENMVESTQIIAGKLYGKALDLFHDDNSFEVTGPVKFIHQYVKMPNEKIEIQLPNGTLQQVTGCFPAMGYSFAGGTTDGPGEFDFSQGTVTDNPFWDAVRDFLFPPTDEDIACHSPKPILIFTGGVDFPYIWQPQIVATQIVTIGEVALVAVPGEFTTMSGRRLRAAVKEAIVNNGGAENTKPIITGLSNVYTNYIATFEEYQLQRYEGGSTVFGPYTLDIYLNKYRELATALMKGETLAPGPTPPDFSSELITLVTPPYPDGLGEGQSYGDCLQQPPKTVELASSATVAVKFVSGNPRNDVLHDDTYFSVEQQVGDDWILRLTDANWETRFKWERTNSTTGENVVTIEWDVDPETIEVGVYRIRHKGHYRTEDRQILPYEGMTDTFEIV